MSQEAFERASTLIERLKSLAPDEHAKAQNYCASLSEVLEEIQENDAQRSALLLEFEEAYAKLTAPANRIGVYIRDIDGQTSLVALADTEYVVAVDPNVDESQLSPGARVKLNEAFAVVGVVESSPSGPLARVSEALEDGRLRVGGDMPGSEGRFVVRSADLKESKIEAGDEIRLESTGRVAVEHFAKRESRDFFMEDIPEIPWTAVGGQEDAIRLIRETIEQPLLHPEIFERFDKKPIKGILLYGPPGCGKTLIGRATAYNLTQEYAKQVGHEVKEYFMAISGPKILNMWLGETERMVREIFNTARQKAKEGRLVFIFLDEAESVLRTRSSGRWLNISNTVVPQFCAELDGLMGLENVVLMLTSNRPDYIDPAVLRPERIDRKVKVGRPNEEAARQIMGIYLHASLPVDPSLAAKHKCDLAAAREELLDAGMAALWSRSKEAEFLRISYRNGSTETLYRSDLVSGALIKSIVDRAKDTAIRRAIADPAGDHGLSTDDVTVAVAAEYGENEIFPKSDVQEDWLKLLDVDPENVTAVKPIGKKPERDWAATRVL